LAAVGGLWRRRNSRCVFPPQAVTPRRRWRRAVVVVKPHSPTPARVEIVAEAIHAAFRTVAFTRVFSLILANSREVVRLLVQHPLIKAWALTGSLGGAARSSTSCAQRPSRSVFR